MKINGIELSDFAADILIQDMKNAVKGLQTHLDRLQADTIELELKKSKLISERERSQLQLDGLKAALAAATSTT